MNCDTCFTDYICACGESVVINTRLTPGVTYYWRVEDKFEKIYAGAVVAESDGRLIIPVSELPAGLLNEYAGSFVLSFSDEVSCGTIAIPLAKNYDCIRLEVKGGTHTKDTVGCDVPCSAGTGETVIIPFEDQETINVDWSLYAATMGNTPLVQVYHETSPNVYQLAAVSIEQLRTNNVLTSIVVNNAGPATGYILITQ